MNDLINRNKLLDEIDKMTFHATLYFPLKASKIYEIKSIMQKLLDSIIEIIMNSPSESDRIPCSERLPEVGIPVLIYDKHHKAFFVAKLDEDYFGFSSNMWHHPADVPFWMPLPEQPKEGDNDA